MTPNSSCKPQIRRHSMGARFTHAERLLILAACKRRHGSSQGKARATFLREAVLATVVPPHLGGAK